MPSESEPETHGARGGFNPVQALKNVAHAIIEIAWTPRGGIAGKC